MINESLLSSDAERKEAIQKGKAIFGFTLKNKEGKEDSWFIDLKDTGKVSKEPPKKPDGMPALIQVLALVFRFADCNTFDSRPFTLGGRLWETRVWESKCAEAFHVWKA